MASYTPQQVANYFISLCIEDNKTRDPMKILKLVYIAYAWYMATYDERLFNENIEAWDKGPVVPSLYHEFKRFGYNNIDDFSHEMDSKVPPVISNNDSRTLALLTAVYNMYSDKTGDQLSDITHENEAWRCAFINGRNTPLNDDDIKKCAKKGIAKYFELQHAGKIQ